MLTYLMTWWRARCGDEKGQALVEYGLIIALIAVVVIGTLFALGGQLNDFFQNIKGHLEQVPVSQPGGNP